MSDIETIEETGRTSGRISRGHLAEFCDYTAAMLAAGITLLESLDECALSHEGGSIGRFSARMALGLRCGASFAAAVDGCGERLPPVFRQLAAAGERSGSLDRALHEAAELLREDDRARDTIIGAAAYPLVVLLAIVAFLVVLQLLVIPASGRSLTSLSPPLLVRIAAIQRTARLEAAAITIATALFPVTATLLVRARGGAGALAAIADRLLRAVPLIGKLLAARELRLFVVALHSFASHAVSIEAALYEASALVSGIPLRTSLRAAAVRIEQGTPAARALAAEPLIPGRLRRAVALAEQTGSLQEVLPALTEHYRWESAQRLRRLEQLTEPLLVGVCGVVVALVVVSVVLPLLSLFGEAL